jgi:hypothetical protein
MSNTRVLLGGLLAAMLAGLPAGGADADEIILPCIQRDLHLVTLVEVSGAANVVSGQILADAVLAMVDARKLCLERRVGDSLAQYDRITRQIVNAGAPAFGLADEGRRSAQN